MEAQDNILKELILDIESAPLKIIQKRPFNETYELRAYQWLLSNLVGGIGVLFIRSLLSRLFINEHHIFQWRLENKYIQYLILTHYNPGCMPVTVSFSKLMGRTNGRQKINELIKEGFFLKATLGEGSGKTDTFDRTAEIEQIVNLHQTVPLLNQNENWILQKKLALKAEFRIHTFNDNIIYGLTFKITGAISLDNCKAEEFVKNILNNLPGTISQGALIAWDIGLTDHNGYFVIESNFTGFHPVFNYGFQTSGHFQDHTYGPASCAWFNMYIQNKYQISVASIENSLLAGTRFYRAFTFYKSTFKYEHLRAFISKTKDSPLSAIVYMSEETDSLYATLIAYFQRINYADMYYIITNEEYITEVSELFAEHNDINIIQETVLFTKEQYQLVKQLNYERRKQISCYHTFKRIKKCNCVIV